MVMSRSNDPRPLVAHVVHRFDVGGLENGVVNLINRMPAERFRHAVVAMTEVGEFRRRVQRADVEFHALHKPPGQGLKIAPQFVALMRQLRPAIVHTRNLGALEMCLPAAWAGVPVRVHGEHGWDSNDPDGRSRKCQWIRRAYRPFVHRYVALSRHLENYLMHSVGVPAARISQLYNGVDTLRFRPALDGRERVEGAPPMPADAWVVGTVGRLHAIKDQLLLARAFLRARELAGAEGGRLRLAIAGDGPLRPELEAMLEAAGAGAQVWLAGERDDVPQFMRGLDLFVLPSRAEGISNTILEAMASGLPVLATEVGGNGELLDDPSVGTLVPSGDQEAMAAAIAASLQQPEQARERGLRARQAAQRRFSLDGMVAAYGDLYERLLQQAAERGALQRA